jgi:hypothetical protein
MNEQHKCSGNIRKDWHSYPCSKNGKLEHEGRFYCGMHHPPTVLAKNQAKTAAWHKEWDEKRAAEVSAAAAKAEVARRAALYPELMAALSEFIDEHASHTLTETERLTKARAAIARALPQGAPDA